MPQRTNNNRSSYVCILFLLLLLAASASLLLLPRTTTNKLRRYGQYAGHMVASSTQRAALAMGGEVDTSWHGLSTLVFRDMTSHTPPSPTTRGPPPLPMDQLRRQRQQHKPSLEASTTLPLPPHLLPELAQSACLLGAAAPAYARYVVDIGAHDGIWQSNTHLFLQRGFAGLLVEAHPANYEALVRNVAQYAPAATTARLAVGLQSGVGRVESRGWFDNTEAIVRGVSASMTGSGGSSGGGGGTHAGTQTNSTVVPVMTLGGILAAFGVPARFALLSMDVEWRAEENMYALRSMLRRGFVPQYIVIENAPHQALQHWGYSLVETRKYDSVYRLCDTTLPLYT